VIVFKSIGKLFRVLWAGVDGVRKVLHLILLLALFAIIGAALNPEVPTFPGSTALVIAPTGALVEELEGDPFDRALSEVLEEAAPQTRMRDVLDALHFAKTDDRVNLVILELDGLAGGGLSKLQRLGAAIEDFRESGKSVIATANFYSQPGYYVAAHADEVYMHADGMFLPQGFSLYANYFSEAIEKLKIDWNIFRVGNYKSAVEPFTRMDMSEEDERARTALVSKLWNVYQDGIVRARELEPGALDDFANNLLTYQIDYDGDIAVAAEALGFVDRLVTADELQQQFADLVGEDEDSDRGYYATGVAEYVQQMRPPPPLSRENGVAIVVASGEVLNGMQAPGTIGGESTALLLRQARLDESIQAVVLRIDTPGGSSFAAEQIRNEIEALRASGKPVVASMSSVAASAGYWIAMAADAIYASESTITGSIGVFLMFPTFEGTLGELGIATDGVGTTRWSGEFRPDMPLSDDAGQFLQGFVDKGYDDFISMVAMYRDMEKPAVNDVAQGQVWTGADALEFGLIDALGNLDQAVERAAELANLNDEGYDAFYFEAELSPAERMLVDLLGGAARLGIDLSAFKPRSSPAADRVLKVIDSATAPLFQFDDPRGMYSHCFCAVL